MLIEFKLNCTKKTHTFVLLVLFISSQQSLQLLCLAHYLSGITLDGHTSYISTEYNDPHWHP